MPRLSVHELANLIGELHAGRNPAWFEQAALPSPPQIATDGALLTSGDDGGALVSFVQIRVRKVAAYRTAIYQITEDNSQTYTVGIDLGAGFINVTYVSDPTATKQEIADGLKLAIEADPTFNANLLVYSEKDPVTGLYRLRVTGKKGSTLDDGDFGITTASATGAGALTVTADAAQCVASFWGFPGGTLGTASGPVDLNAYQSFVGDLLGKEESSPWLQIPNPSATATAPPLVISAASPGDVQIHSAGYMNGIATSGLSRLAVKVDGITAPALDTVGSPTVTLFTPRVIIGPARRESDRPLGSTV